jgi:hypothetical protein
MEWLARYSEYLAALRAGLYGMASGRTREWDAIRSRAENIVSAAEDIAEGMIYRSVRADEPGFIRFLDEKRMRFYANSRSFG